MDIPVKKQSKTLLILWSLLAWQAVWFLTKEMKMTKRKYLAKLLELLTPEQIKLSASKPTPYMSAMHIKLHFVALRRLGVLWTTKLICLVPSRAGQ